MTPAPNPQEGTPSDDQIISEFMVVAKCVIATHDGDESQLVATDDLEPSERAQMAETLRRFRATAPSVSPPPENQGASRSAPQLPEGLERYAFLPGDEDLARDLGNLARQWGCQWFVAIRADEIICPRCDGECTTDECPACAGTGVVSVLRERSERQNETQPPTATPEPSEDTKRLDWLEKWFPRVKAAANHGQWSVVVGEGRERIETPKTETLREAIDFASRSAPAPKETTSE